MPWDIIAFVSIEEGFFFVCFAKGHVCPVRRAFIACFLYSRKEAKA
jgi:hypothetical protein